MTYCWPFSPQAGPTETLEWLTDVIRCHSAEQRLCMRPIPRQEFSYSYKVETTDFGRARELAKAIGGSEFYLPIWTELTEVGAVSAGATVLSVDATGKCYANGGKLIVYDSDDDYEVCTIQSIGTGTITVNPAVVHAYSAACVMPIRYATFPQEVDASRFAAGYQEVAARFVCTATEDLSGETGLVYVEYLGDPVITTPTFMFGGSVGEQYSRDLDTFDTRTGQLYRWPVTTWSKQSSVVSWNPKTADELWLTRVWMHQMKGRWKQFWASSWNEDLVITSPIAADDTAIEIADIDYAATYPATADFIIVTTGGEFFGFHVTGTGEGSAGHEVLTISAELGTALALADISRCCRIVKSRFDSDRVEIQYGPGGGARISMPTTEVP